MTLSIQRLGRRSALSALAALTALSVAVPATHAAPSTKETRVTGKLAGWAQAVSNRGTGGAGRFGCRADRAGDKSCLRSNNVGGGYAFLFATSGDAGGFIRVGTGGDGTRPFTTNATGVATGLNSDRLDGHDASDFLLAAAKAFDADKLDGLDASAFVKVGDPVGDADTLDGLDSTDLLQAGAPIDADTLGGQAPSDFVPAASRLSLAGDPRLDIGDGASTLGSAGGLTFEAMCIDAGPALRLTLDSDTGTARFGIAEPSLSLSAQVDVPAAAGDVTVLDVSSNEIGSNTVTPAQVSVVRDDGTVYSGTVTFAVGFGPSDCFVSGVLLAG